jgi:hypothetical protein
MFKLCTLGSIRYWFKNNKDNVVLIQKDFSKCFLSKIPPRLTTVDAYNISESGFRWAPAHRLTGSRSQRIEDV